MEFTKLKESLLNNMTDKIIHDDVYYMNRDTLTVFIDALKSLNTVRLLAYRIEGLDYKEMYDLKYRAWLDKRDKKKKSTPPIISTVDIIEEDLMCVRCIFMLQASSISISHLVPALTATKAMLQGDWYNIMKQTSKYIFIEDVVQYYLDIPKVLSDISEENKLLGKSNIKIDDDEGGTTIGVESLILDPCPFIVPVSKDGIKIDYGTLYRYPIIKEKSQMRVTAKMDVSIPYHSNKGKSYNGYLRVSDTGYKFHLFKDVYNVIPILFKGIKRPTVNDVKELLDKYSEYTNSKIEERIMMSLDDYNVNGTSVSLSVLYKNTSYIDADIIMEAILRADSDIDIPIKREFIIMKGFSETVTDNISIATSKYTRRKACDRKSKASINPTSQPYVADRTVKASDDFEDSTRATNPMDIPFMFTFMKQRISDIGSITNRDRIFSFEDVQYIDPLGGSRFGMNSTMHPHLKPGIIGVVKMSGSKSKEL